MLSNQEQWLVNHAKDGQHHYQCPWCSPARKKKHEDCLSAHRDHERIVYACHHCGVSGAVSVRERSHEKLEPRKETELKRIEDFQPLGEPHYEWLTSRGISVSTAHKYDLVADESFGRDVVGFPYFDSKGNVTALKKRFLDEKKFLCWQSPTSFFGLRHIKKGDNLYIVEGEADLLSLAEVGISAVSVPNGAPMKVTEGRIDPSEDKKFKFLWDAKDYIDAAERVYIATDTDGPGEALAEEIARRVGKAKSWRVRFPEGIKDANDCLVKLGAAALVKQVEKAEPWPVQGLYDAHHFGDLVWELYEKGAGRGESTGYDSVDDLYTIVPGQVTIVTGAPNSGKSSFVDAVMVNLAESKAWKFGVCSFENEPRIHIAKLMSIRSGMPFFEGPTRRMNREEARASFDWVNDHFSFVHQDDGGLAGLDSILDRLKIAILRYGIRGVVVDPYSFIDRDTRDMSETEWVSQMLTKVKAFAMSHGIHFWFVAHPTKLQRGSDGKIPPPRGYDISGSSHWFAKADCGITIHRDPDQHGISKFICWKSRFSWVGKQGETRLLYDVPTMRYFEAPQDEGDFQL